MATQVSLNSGAVASAGALALQTNGTTQAISISTGQVATLAQNPILSSGTINSVQYLDSSKILTSDSNFVYTTTGLGIGTSSPAYKFQVSQNQNANTTSSVSNTTAGTSSLARFLALSDTANASFGVTSSLYTDITGAANAAYINSNGSGGIVLANSGVVQAKLDSSGNLGLGVTPSAWRSNLRANQFGLGGLVVGSTANSFAAFASNYYTDASSVERYINTDFASQYYQLSGAHVWRTAPVWNPVTNPTGAITFTQAMTLDASGNLGVGTTSPALRIHGAVAGTAGARIENTASTGAAYWQAKNTATSVDYGVDANGGFIQTNGAYSTVFYTNGSERARIDSSGNLLVGTTSTSAGARLYVKGSGASNVAARFYNSDETDGNPTLYIDKPSATTTTSQMFIGFTVNAQTAGSGQINANGASQAAFGSFSDRRLKEKIVDLPPQLANIMALRPVEFDYIESEGGGHQISFIAQEFEQVYPDAVGERADGMKTLTGWSKTEARLVKAIQEQNQLIQSLTDRISALEGAKA